MSAKHRKLLITLLGRAARKDGGYQQTVYILPDGTTTEPAAFVGWEVAKAEHPDEIVVLGTAGSMWDWLVEKTRALNAELIDAVEDQRVTQAQLDQLVIIPPASSSRISLKVISECRTAKEQLALLSEIEPLVQEGDELILDLTHGYRHLPMLLLLAVVYLRSIRSIRIAAVYSSFYDADSRQGHLFDISGLMKLFDWQTALSAFHKDGDPGVFSGLLKSDGCGETVLQPLREASYNNRILRPENALSSERAVVDQLEQCRPMGVSGLFARYLVHHLGSMDGAKPTILLARMARRQLQLGNFDRASLLGLNAACASQAKPGEDLSAVHSELVNGTNARGTPEIRGAYQLLYSIRSAIAHVHGRPQNREATKALATERGLREKFEELFDKLLPRH